MPRRASSHSPAQPELIVTQPADLAACLEHLDVEQVLAFDTEFVGEDSYRPDLCLVQVATSERLYIIDPFTCGPLDAFWRMLLDPAKTVVVHAGREDVRICHFAIGAVPPRLFDVQIAAGLIGLNYPIGYAGAVFELLGKRMHKSETLTDWRRRPLTPNQLRYAFDDVRYLIPAYERLLDRLRRLEREDWANEEFATFSRRALGEEAAIEKWRKIKGIGSLDRRGLAIAREIYRWREEQAERVDRPPRTLLRDDLLTEIARRAPGRLDELRTLRGFSSGVGEPILEAVRRGNELSSEDLPELVERENDSQNVLMLANLLGVVLSNLCAKRELASTLTATGQDLKAIVRSRVAREPLPEINLTRGWRAAAVLPELLAVLDGEQAVRVVKPRSAAPLGYATPSPKDEKPGSGA